LTECHGHQIRKWWDKSSEEIDSLIPILTCSDLDKVREELKKRI